MIVYWNNALKSSSLRVLLPVPNPLESIPDHGNYSPITENLVSAAIYHVFSERELTTEHSKEFYVELIRLTFLANVNEFTFAICRRASVCLLSVCNVRAPYSADCWLVYQ